MKFDSIATTEIVQKPYLANGHNQLLASQSTKKFALNFKSINDVSSRCTFEMRNPRLDLRDLTKASTIKVF